MGSTNKTTGYELPQWIGTDKPTFLGDLNDAFLKIDNGMTANKGDATSAVATAGAAKQSADNATTKVTELTQTVAALNESVEASDAKADAATATAQQALSTANAQASVVNGHTNSINALNASVGAIEGKISGNIWSNGILSNLAVGGTLLGGFVSMNPYLGLLLPELRFSLPRKEQRIHRSFHCHRRPVHLLQQTALYRPRPWSWHRKQISHGHSFYHDPLRSNDR